jgi:hypothetical protein
MSLAVVEQGPHDDDADEAVATEDLVAAHKGTRHPGISP